MDLDRTSLGERAQDLRSRSQQGGEQPAEPREVAPPVAPSHGGPLATSRVDQQTKQEADEPPESRRRRALDAVGQFLHMPGDTELDIEVDPQSLQVRFLIRDRRTGELLREVPEDESRGLIEALRESLGSLVDRSL